MDLEPLWRVLVAAGAAEQKGKIMKSQTAGPTRRPPVRYRDGRIVLVILLALVVFNLTCNAAIGINVFDDTERTN